MESGSSGMEVFRVVVIDDNVDDRAEIKRLLLRGADRRYVFKEADTAESGMKLVLAEAAVDCVLLDYALPDLEAPEVLAALTAPDGLTVCPIVVLTGSSASQAGKAVMRAGAQDYLGKDWLRPETLTRAVENAIERWRMAQELQAQRVALQASEAEYRHLFQSAHEAQTRLRLALQASNTGIWTWDWVSDSVTWSPECYVIHGIAPGDFSGTGAAFFALVHPEDRPRVESTVRSAIATRALYACEFRVVKPGGEVVWVQNLGRVIGESDAEPRRMLGTLTDISERKKTSDMLAESEERLARAQHAAQVGTWDWDLRTGRMIWTDEVWRLLDRDPSVDTASYELWLSCVCPEDRERAASRMRASFPGGPFADEFSVCRRDGNVRRLELVGEALLGDDGVVTRALGTVRDVTERHEADVSLRAALLAAEQQVRAREQLVSVVSHDLRNPLSVLKMAVYALQDSARKGAVEGSAPLTSSLERMARQTGRMEKLVDELLDVAQMHDGRPLQLSLQDCDLASLVSNIANEHQREAPKHRITLYVLTSPLFVRGDRTRLARVVNNLLSNAVKYSPGSPEIRVELEASGGPRPEAVLRVIDNGIGIAREDQKRIFDWFARGHNAQSSSIRGTGVGLASIKQIVAQHGGSVTVDSEVGRGSSFVVKIPLAARTT